MVQGDPCRGSAGTTLVRVDRRRRSTQTALVEVDPRGWLNQSEIVQVAPRAVSTETTVDQVRRRPGSTARTCFWSSEKIERAESALIEADFGRGLTGRLSRGRFTPSASRS
jgi:hypothetical protein